MIRTLLAILALGILVGMVGKEIGYTATIMTLLCFRLLFEQLYLGLIDWLPPNDKEEKIE